MSFSPQVHGSFAPFQLHPDNSSTNSDMFMDMSSQTAEKIAELQAKLNRKLGPEYISQRPGPSGGPKLTYAEGWKIINLANEVFGFNGWSSSIVNMTVDFVDLNDQTQRWSVGCSAVVRVTLRDGVFHEDVGYGVLENSRSKGAALDKCKKEAVTDGVKRALRNFGNLLGNCLYDKSYTQEVVKIKVTPRKFDTDDLHRPSNETKTPTPTRPSTPLAGVPRSISAIPAHVRADVKSTPVRPKSPTPRNQNSPRGPSTLSLAVAPTKPLQAVKTELVSPPVAGPSVNAPTPAQADTLKSFPSTVSDEYAHAFGSMDDEFFANIDLSELDADLGRPVGAEEGVGGAIDFEEGAKPMQIDTPVASAFNSPAIQRVNASMPAQTANSPTHIHPPPQQQQQKPTTNTSNADARSVRLAAILSACAEQSANAGRNVTTPAVADENINTSVTTGSNAPPTRSPPMGCFNYPGGKAVAAQSLTGAAQPSVQVGVKRPADMISTSYGRNPAAGMGLAQAQAAAVQQQQRRQPFTPLPIDGNDPKRTRY